MRIFPRYGWESDDHSMEDRIDKNWILLVEELLRFSVNFDEAVRRRF